MGLGQISSVSSAACPRGSVLPFAELAQASYHQYSAQVSQPELSALASLHAQQIWNIACGRKSARAEFLKLRAAAVDIAAAKMIPLPRLEPVRQAMP